MDLQKLTLLAESIHDNCLEAGGPRHAEGIAEHMRLFWSPLMRRELTQAQQQGKVSLSPATIAALEQLDGC